MEIPELADALLAEISRYKRMLVAFSGGVDSSVVLHAGVLALGSERVEAVTAVSPSLPAAELEIARNFCVERRVFHHLPTTDELSRPGYRENGPRRCYFCKSVLLDTATALATERDLTIATGTNASDITAGFRPGIRAAAERGARTPLADIGLSKDDVRAVARLWGLSVWNKPAAACTASRVAYGIPVTRDRLARIERAEVAVRAVLDGVRDLRVRDLGDAVRLEVDAESVARVRADDAAHRAIRQAGFGDRPIEVSRFRSGSMNDVLERDPTVMD
ncbi:ATP-dependent sacrificial sulfur transferase LarE [Nocardia terpenica]|uniref:ATP-dependent sacrificial sulfur transferase LarE n=2 Tax=Nocardia terpenica TaxID=455432 RepID=A0A6G9YZA3_9NOCA|nr:ATP-dependent sacrificial sulfur transferase LarE [Nocardia terpenica]QIS18441.1 ATP-dependent sacrificial sulfur transferase LarE [Nocardia terpenica]